MKFKKHVTTKGEKGFYAYKGKVHVQWKGQGGKVQWKGSNRMFILSGLVNYNMPGGGSAVFERTGKGKNSDIKMIYYFKKPFKIKKRLNVLSTSEKIYKKYFREYFYRRFYKL